jgi:hypothetical protein
VAYTPYKRRDNARVRTSLIVPTGVGGYGNIFSRRSAYLHPLLRRLG